MRHGCLISSAVVVALVLAGADATGQPAATRATERPAAAPQPITAPPTAKPEPLPTPTAPHADGYSYKPEGRRDPFLSLLNRGSEPRAPGRKLEGFSSFGVGDISLKGVLASRGAYLAMVQGPDGKTYIVHTNDRLLDGVVRSITADTLVVVQEVNDPLSLTKQREVRKALRVLEEVK